jgi:Anti-sigma-K factor rskA
MNQTLTEFEQLLAAGYVLGDLDPEEQRQFEQQLTQSPALRAEVQALQASLRVLPMAQLMLAPPPGLRARVMAATGVELGVENTAASTVTSSAQVSPSSPYPIPSSQATSTPPRQLNRAWPKIIAALTSLGALLLGFDNLRLRQALSVANQPNGEAVAVSTLMQRPNSRLVSLRGTGSNAEAAGTLMFTPGKWQEVVVSLGNLPPLPPDQVYRMWLTLKNGQVISCGEFKTTAQKSVFIRLNPAQNPPPGVKATGVFVTIDAANAPLTPSGPRVIIGNI